ncbi:MAG: hypothetical protein RLZZ96_182 [Bacteroidota bacterium]|jgi:hypothetical protein
MMIQISKFKDQSSKNIHFFFLLCSLLFAKAVFAQDNHAPSMPAPPIPVEATFGNNRVQFIGVLNRPVSADGKLSYFNLSMGMVDYKNTASETEMVIVNNLTYTLFGNVRATAGAEWHYKLGLVPQVGLQYFKANRTWLFLLNPNLNLQPSKAISTIGIVEFKPAISKDLSFYSKAQVLHVASLSEGTHARSALMLRAGITKGKFTLGLGANFDYYGPMKIEKNNVGLFTRLAL